MNYHFKKLEIGRDANDRSITVMAPIETCDFYGWSEAFEVWTPRKTYLGDGRVAFKMTKPRTMNGDAGGKRFRISRSPSRSGFPAGFTNAFRLSSNWRQEDLIKLGESTQVDWYWITGPTGHKWLREELLQDRLIGLTQ